MLVKKRNYINSKRSNPASQFDKRLILQIVKGVEEGLPRKEACSIYGMAYATINQWMRTYASEDYRKNLRNPSTGKKRREIVKLVLAEKITKQQAAVLCKVSKKTITTWLRLAKKEEAELISSNHNDMPTDITSCSQIDLQKQLKEARLKIKALDTMIDIAEQQFKIAIRKKPGAKQ
jgi:transposase